jgi:hypothetical protein
LLEDSFPLKSADSYGKYHLPRAELPDFSNIESSQPINTSQSSQNQKSTSQPQPFEVLPDDITTSTEYSSYHQVEHNPKRTRSNTDQNCRPIKKRSTI